MSRADRTAAGASIAAVLVAIGMAWAGSQGGSTIRGIPVFALAFGLAFLIQWLAFIPAYVGQTERYFDLIGSLSFVIVTALAVLLSPPLDPRSMLLLALVSMWAARLGTFLFRRVKKAGTDSRFDDIKPSFVRFLSTWTIQGLWVSLTLAAALVAITSTNRAALDGFALAGFALWVTGFAIEAAADVQKQRFRADDRNKGAFVSTGLWAWSRHPNYFGEILLWIGVAVIALPVLAGWQWVTLISPVFVFLLITRASGIPLLEKKADATWGAQPDYEAYKKRTPLLLPRPPR